MKESRVAVKVDGLLGLEKKSCEDEQMIGFRFEWKDEHQIHSRGIPSRTEMNSARLADES